MMLTFLGSTDAGSASTRPLTVLVVALLVEAATEAAAAADTVEATAAVKEVRIEYHGSWCTR
jgi:hypothetical protein